MLITRRSVRKNLQGLETHVGNLPFDVDEKAITAFFGDKATITEIAIATDKGKLKGFAFVFIEEKDKGDEVVKALNGQELNGRRLKVDISQAGGRKKSQGGKSARELKAIAEEKQKKRRR